jgi:hypothetical protein
MKILIVCLLLFGLIQELASAAPQPPRLGPRPRERLRTFKRPGPRTSIPASKFPLHTWTPSGPRILGGGGGGGEPQNDKTAINQVLPLALALAPTLTRTALNLAPEVLKLGASLGRSVLCDRDSVADSWIQEYYAGNEEEKDAKLVALVKVMGDMLAAQGKLSEAKKLNVENNVVAKAELFDAIGDALGGALDFVGDTAKGVLCIQ